MTDADKKQPSVTTFDVEISPNESRSYRGLILPNQLKVVLVSDPEADKAGAALDVNVGQFSDPSELPGLAHFCEHMLFLGTEKYPNENEYSEYLSKHGGYSNAFTDKENTDYHFEVCLGLPGVTCLDVVLRLCLECGTLCLFCHSCAFIFARVWTCLSQLSRVNSKFRFHLFSSILRNAMSNSGQR